MVFQAVPTHLCVLDDSVAEPDNVRQRIAALDDADEDERSAEVEGALHA